MAITQSSPQIRTIMGLPNYSIVDIYDYVTGDNTGDKVTFEILFDNKQLSDNSQYHIIFANAHASAPYTSSDYHASLYIPSTFTYIPVATYLSILLYPQIENAVLGEAEQYDTSINNAILRKPLSLGQATTTTTKLKLLFKNVNTVLYWYNLRLLLTKEPYIFF